MTDLELRTPPHDPAAERGLLGAMLGNPDVIVPVADLVTAVDFYRPAHAAVFAAIAALHDRGEPTDPVAVTAALLAGGELERVGGPVLLAECVEQAALSATWCAERIARLAEKRRLIEAGTRVVQLGFSPDDEVTDQAQRIIHDATTRRRRTSVARLGEVLPEALQAIEDAGRNPGLRGLSTGLWEVDQITGGLSSGQLIIVAGRPGMGKTTFALDILRHAALDKPRVPSLVFSLEMTRRELIERIISAETSIAHNLVRDGKLNEQAWDRVTATAAAIEDAPLFIDATDRLDLPAIRATARRTQQQHGLGLVVVDYLQLMRTLGKHNRATEVGEVAVGLKNLAKELDCPVVACAQLNRASESRGDKRPAVADLRESGDIEAAADVVILLHRDAYYDRKSSRGEEADVIIGKNRHGPQDNIVAAAHLWVCRFADLAA